MKYNCDTCNYKTDCRVSWHKHINTIKHKKKSTEKDSVDINNIKKDHEIELLKEKLKAIESEKNNIEKQLQNERIMFERQLKLTENQLIKTENQLNSTKQQYENHIETLKNENNFQKQLINSAGGMIQKSMNTLSFLLLNYNNAPCLQSLDDYSIISKNVDYLIKDLIFYFKKSKLDKYLGDFIVKHYKKDNPELQAMWNSDTERLNYFIRELYNIKNSEIVLKNDENKKIDNQWIVDRKGLKMTKCIINPLLDYICNLNINYLKQKNKENNEADLKERESILKDMETIALINCDIKNHNLSKNINKYIAPYFYLDKGNHKLIKSK